MTFVQECACYKYLVPFNDGITYLWYADFYSTALKQFRILRQWLGFIQQQKRGAIKACDGRANPHWKDTTQCCGDNTLWISLWWLVVNLPSHPPPGPFPSRTPTCSVHKLGGSLVVGTRVLGTDGKVGAQQSAVCTEYRAKGACREAACQQGTELGAICCSSSPFCHQVCHLILLSGDTNDEHVLNSFVYLATAFLRGGLN